MKGCGIGERLFKMNAFIFSTVTCNCNKFKIQPYDIPVTGQVEIICDEVPAEINH